MVKYFYKKSSSNFFVVGYPSGLFGDKETAVQFRDNSHYRNSRNAYRTLRTFLSLGREGEDVKGRRVSALLPCSERGTYFFT